MQGYRAEVRRTFEATEKIFAADMKWRDEWVEGRKKERRNERRKVKRAPKEGEEEPAGGQEERVKHSGGRIFPEDEEESHNGSPGREAPNTEDSSGGSGRAARAGGDNTGLGRRVPAEEQGQPFSAEISGTERRHSPEDDEGARDAEEGVLTRPLGKRTTTENDPEAPPGGGEPSAGTAGPGARPRSTRSNGWRRTWRRSTFSSPKSSAAAEEGVGDVERAPAEDRTRGPCQGSGPLDVSKQGLEKQQQCHQELLEADPPPSAPNVGATEEGTPSLIPASVPRQGAEGVAEGDGTPGRAEGPPDRAD